MKKKLLVLLMALGMVGTVSGVSQGQLHYRLNETGGTLSKDYTGNGNDASSFGGSPTQGVEGISQSSGSWGDDLAYDFDEGGDDHINEGNVSVSDDFTLSAWIKVDSGASGQENIMGSFDGTDGVIWRDVDSDGNLDLWINGNTARGALNYKNDKWYFAAVVFDDSANEATFYLNKTNTTLSISADKTQIDNSWDVSFPGDGGVTGSNRPLDGTIDEPRIFDKALNSTEIKNLRKYNCPDGSCANNPPSIDSTDYDPDDPDVNDTIDTYMNASDPDGDTITGYLTVEEGGTTIIDGKVMDTAGPHDFRLLDNFTADEVDTFYNMTFKASDGNTNTSTERSFYINDTSPGVKVVKPKNQTYFKYHPAYKAKVNSDGDDVPNEESDCTLYDDGSPFRSVTLTEGGSSVNGQVNHTVGQYSFTGECTEQNASANTKNDTVTYTIDRFEIQSKSSSSTVYETKNTTYSTSVKVGSMVNNLTTNLYWNASPRTEKIESNSGINTYSQDHYFEIPLVPKNNTEYNWSFEAEINYKDFNANTNSTSIENSTNTGQKVYHSYYIESSDTIPKDGDYIEREDLQHQVQIHTETKKAAIDGTTTYSRDGSTDSMDKIANTSSTATFEGVIDTGNASNFNKSSYNASSSLTINFNGESRTIDSGNDQVNVYKIKLTDGTTNLNTAKALQFNIFYEENGYKTKAKLGLDLSIWKTKEIIRRYSFKEPAAKSHSYYIYPSWAQYKIQTKPYPDTSKFDLIQYWNDNTGKVRRSYFFPTPTTIDNQTTNVPLRTINSTEATQIDFEVTNSEGDPAPNVYCRVDRKFAGGDFSTVFMIKTGSNGKSQSFAEINEIYYSFTCFKNGQIADRFSAQLMQDPMRLQLGGGQVETTLDFYQKFDADCTKNNTALKCDYQSQSDELEKAELVVKRKEVMQDVTVCTETGKTATGRLSCTGLNATENRYTYNLQGFYPNDVTVPGTSGFLGNLKKPFPGVGILMVAIIFMLVTAASAFNLVVGIGSGTLVFLLTSQLQWIILTPSQKATLIAVAIIAGAAATQ